MQLLMVEDDVAVRRLVTNRLERQGVTVTAAATAGAALRELRESTFDVAIFDLTLPDGSGLDLLRMLRKRGTATHVIILSGADSESDRVGALGQGADDYVVKPFFVRELTARVMAVGRRQEESHAHSMVFGPLAIDLVARQVTVNDKAVDLTAKEFDLLAFLSARPRHAFSRDELLHSVWQSAAEWQQESTVTEHVRRLRAKIEHDPQQPSLVMTVRGVGYRFDAPPSNAYRHRSLIPVGGAEPEPGEDGTVVLVEGRVVSADEAAVEMVGVGSEADLLGRDVMELVAPQSQIAVRARRAASASGPVLGSQILAVRRGDGKDVYLQISSVPAEWKGKAASASTLRRHVDPAAQLRHLVTGVFSEVSDAVIVTDPQYHVRSWNQAAEHLYGWAAHEVLGRRMNDVVPFIDNDNELSEHAQTLEEKGRWFGEGQQIARDGSLVSVFASTTLIRDDSGETVVVVSVNRPAIVSPTLAVVSDPVAHDEADIRRGLDADEFDVHYQPVVALDDLHVIAFEALARWNHPERGVLTPAYFIDAAERSGLILELGQVIFDQACRQCAEWRRAGIDIEVGVNLSTKQLADGALYDRIAATLAASELDPHALWLEVTETALVEDLDQAADLLHRLAARGIRVAIDDFGTGWASLTYLKQFPVHALKIDQIFVEGVDHNPQDAAIARSIVSLGAELDMQVVAEGVETAAQQAALQALGCSIAQGYLYGKPTPVADVAIERAHRL